MRPSARYGHTAVWTGSEMIVWGGDDGSTFSTPAEDTIRAPTVGQPPALSMRLLADGSHSSVDWHVK